MRKRPVLKSTDKRRKTHAHEHVGSEGGRDTNGAGPPLDKLFNDRRKNSRRQNGEAGRSVP